MRASGASYTDIANELGLPKSTIRYMVKDVELTPEQREALAQRIPSTAGQQPKDIEACRRQGRISGTKAWSAECRERTLSATKENVEKACLAYTREELPIKSKLEALYGKQFKKERIGARIVDFASDDLVIEHSTDYGKGLGDMIARLTEIKDDKRRKIAYVNTDQLGPRRRQSLEAVCDEVIDYRALA